MANHKRSNGITIWYEERGSLSPTKSRVRGISRVPPLQHFQTCETLHHIDVTTISLGIFPCLQSASTCDRVVLSGLQGRELIKTAPRLRVPKDIVTARGLLSACSKLTASIKHGESMTHTTGSEVFTVQTKDSMQMPIWKQICSNSSPNLEGPRQV